MSLREISNDVLDSPYVKSYATEKNLRKRIDQDKEMYGDYDDKFIVVRTPEGRWTAIVTLDKSCGGYMGRYEGFMKI